MDKSIHIRGCGVHGARRFPYVAILLAAECIVFTQVARSEVTRTPQSRYGRARRVAELANQEITESSGLASSRRQSGLFWTHNDSGDSPRLFAFDLNGKDLGSCRLIGASATDWEDMASFERNGKAWLLVGDVGDNGLRRDEYQLYLCEEPPSGVANVAAQRINFQYEGKAQDCEAVAVDPNLGTILLCTKLVAPSSDVYTLAIPPEPTRQTQLARKIGSIPVGVTVAMDVSPDGLRAIVLTYTDAFEFTRGADEDWQQGFSRPPRRIPMPLRRQGESICYGHDGRSLFLTSERSPSPLWEVAWETEPAVPAEK